MVPATTMASGNYESKGGRPCNKHLASRLDQPSRAFQVRVELMLPMWMLYSLSMARWSQERMLGERIIP